jgi:hypothetical protein
MSGRQTAQAVMAIQTGLSARTQPGARAVVSFFSRIAFGFRFMFSPVSVKAEVK